MLAIRLGGIYVCIQTDIKLASLYQHKTKHRARKANHIIKISYFLHACIFILAVICNRKCAYPVGRMLFTLASSPCMHAGEGSVFGVCGDMAPVKYHIPARRNASSAVDGEDSWMQRVSDLFARRASEHAQYNSYTCAMRSSILRTCHVYARRLIRFRTCMVCLLNLYRMSFSLTASYTHLSLARHVLFNSMHDVYASIGDRSHGRPIYILRH